MSTTNDEGAKYGEQPNEREPMLPILTTYDEHKSKYGMLGRELYFIDGWGKGADAYRTAMDELITTGNLRVVVEVECRELDLVEEWYSRPTKCLSCGVEFIMALPSGNYAPPNYCPGCGNKIKR